MRNFKVRIAVILALIAVVSLNICSLAAEIPSHTDEFFINDYANVIDSETENYIYEKGKAYNSGGGPQIVVLTMDSIDGDSVENFSIETAREWGIGSKDEDNGVLILLVMDTRDIRIEVGYGLEGVLNDGKCGRFIRRATDMLSSGDYSGGIKQIYDDVIGELEEPTPDNEDGEGDVGGIAAAIVCALVIVFIWYLIGKHGPRGPRGGFYRGGGYYRGGGFGSGGFGGSGGGFSGGGGGFGGGGASGKF